LLAAVNGKQDALTASSDLALNYLLAGRLDVKATGPSDQSLSIISGGEAHDALIYLGTPYDADAPSKCALIAEAISNYSKSKFHICLNNDSDNSSAASATVADSKLSVDRDGVVSIPGSLILNGTDVETALGAGVSVLKATGAIQSSSTEESVEVGRSGVAGIVRIASNFATLRLETVGASQNYTGFSIVRNGVTQVVTCQLGTVAYQSYAPGVNNFHQKVVLYQPLQFNAGPKIQRINGESLEFYSGSNAAFKALTLQGDDGHVVAHIGFHNDSDATLKSDIVPASSERALEVLKAVEPMTYRRNDLSDDSLRLGFIAQHLDQALPPEWANIVGRTGGVDEHVDEEGNTIPAKPSTMTLDYSRLVCCLWAANRSMLARLEALEARLQ
jgi:hypothetical protein